MREIQNRAQWRNRPLLTVALAVGILFSLLFPIIHAEAAAIWQPVPMTTWQWQLTGTVDQSFHVQVYDIDLFDNSASVTSSLQGQGRKVSSHMSAVTWEDWRPDAGQFPDSVKGNSNGWPGERRLDIRQINLLDPINGTKGRSPL